MRVEAILLHFLYTRMAVSSVPVTRANPPISSAICAIHSKKESNCWLRGTISPSATKESGAGNGNTQTGKGCVMGVDIGTRIHVVIRQPGDRMRAMYIGEVDDFEELDAFMGRYQIRAAVVDALPETRKAQEFADRFDGRVYVAYYATQPRGVKRASPYQWSEDEHVVNIDRSRAFDGVLAGYYNKQYENPADPPTITDYYLHLRNLVRVKENLPDGTPVVRYLKLGPDHYAHAENYCLAANFAPYNPGTPPITTMFVGAQRKQT